MIDSNLLFPHTSLIDMDACLSEHAREALQTEETELNRKLVTELTRLKDRKPELFTITAEEQIIKLTAQLGIGFVRWLLE